MAINCWAVPATILGFTGVIASDIKVALVTIKFAVPDTLFAVAVIVAVPGSIPVARPVVVLIAAILGSEVDQVKPSELVSGWVLRSEYTPVALNCWVVPSAITAVVGLTVIDVKTALVTVKLAVLDSPFNVAVICAAVVVADNPVAKPLLPAVLEILTVPLSELQTTELVISDEVPSVKVPEAINCCVVPLAMLAVDGVTVIDFKVAEDTDKIAVPNVVPDPLVYVAVMVAGVVVTVNPVAKPSVEIDTAELFEDQVKPSELVSGCVLPSE